MGKKTLREFLCVKVGLIILLVGFMSYADANAATVFSDGSFAPSDWTSTLITASGSLNAGQVGTGGNPDEYYQVNHNNFSGTLFAVHYQNTATYIPSVEGAIDTIDWTLDEKAIMNYAGIGVAFSVVLQQDGINYIPDPTISGGYYRLNNSSSWSSYGATGMTALDFYDITYFLGSGPSVHPDFSSSGSPILFGFLTANDNTTVTASRAAGFDNWETNVNPVINGLVPEPATLLLLGFGLVGLFGIRRKMKK